MQRWSGIPPKILFRAILITGLLTNVDTDAVEAPIPSNGVVCHTGALQIVRASLTGPQRACGECHTSCGGCHVSRPDNVDSNFIRCHPRTQ